MKKAVIDQMLLWIVMFIGFVTLLFIIIDYYTVIKAKDKSDALSSYGARMVALGKTDAEIVVGLNNLKGNYFGTIYENNMTCTQPVTTLYQVTYTTNITFKNRFLSADEKIYSTSSAFNEVDSSNIDCTLNLSPKD